MTPTYDNLIKTNADRYLPGVDWRLVKAQIYQESRFDINAVSPAGAQGIAQFMPGTWSDMIEKMRMPVNASPFESLYAIPALCYYMAQLYAGWTAPRPDADRYALALASYNAGLGNILKAQRTAGGANDYHRIIAALHHITGDDNANETRTYVKKIFGYFVQQLTEG